MSANANETVREAILSELKRQAAISHDTGERLSVEPSADKVVIHGPVDLDEMAMVVMGSLAGGP